ncbi:ABC transporter ATP-binding protein [Chloroflexota bacterium]
MGNIIEVKHVEKIYTGAVDNQVLFDINLNFEDNSCNSIVGESGSGKSTLINIISTLDKPSSGEVIIDGISTKNMSKNELAELRNKVIGFVFQFHYLLPEFTAVENVLMPYLIKNNQISKVAMEKADELFEILGISKWKNSQVTKMSGGQQQRTAIARALINNPKIVIADEPTGNLDSETTERVCMSFRDINQMFGTTFVVVTHDRSVAAKTDRIIEIRDGKIVRESLQENTAYLKKL